MYPEPIKNLISAFSQLPSVGERTAERFVFHLLKSGKKQVAELALALKKIAGEIKSCEICWNFSDISPCAVCASKNKDKSLICVVEKPQDVQVMEKTKEYNGLYHVLRGVIKPGNVEGAKYIKIVELLKRTKDEDVKEIILALNPDLPGETTMMFLEKKIKSVSPKVKVSRLARGLPMGSELQYADEITLGSALKNRISSK